MWSWILWACREELVATAALGTSEGAAVPGGSTRAVRGNQLPRGAAGRSRAWFPAPPPAHPGAGAAPAARQEEAAGFLPWAPDACLPEPWLQQASLCQISPALGVWAPRGAGWEVRATGSSWLPRPAPTVPMVLWHGDDPR